MEVNSEEEGEKNLDNETLSTNGEATRRGQAILGAWIRIAITNGGILTVARSQWEFKASMSWPLLDGVDEIEAEEKSIEKALTVLEENIQEDAASEVIESGVV